MLNESGPQSYHIVYYNRHKSIFRLLCLLLSASVFPKWPKLLQWSKSWIIPPKNQLNDFHRYKYDVTESFTLSSFPSVSYLLSAFLWLNLPSGLFQILIYSIGISPQSLAILSIKSLLKCQQKATTCTGITCLSYATFIQLDKHSHK